MADRSIPIPQRKTVVCSAIGHRPPVRHPLRCRAQAKHAQRKAITALLRNRAGNLALGVVSSFVAMLSRSSLSGRLSIYVVDNRGDVQLSIVAASRRCCLARRGSRGDLILPLGRLHSRVSHRVCRVRSVKSGSMRDLAIPRFPASCQVVEGGVGDEDDRN